MARIFIAGYRGLVGAAIVRRFDDGGSAQILTATREQLDLRDQAAVNYWFRANRLEYVYLVAGTVGGIMANSTRAARARVTPPHTEGLASTYRWFLENRGALRTSCAGA